MPSYAEELSQLALNNYCRQPGAMYGPAKDLALGAGVIVRNLRYAHFDSSSDRFQARRGSALILTHECDIDQSNTRDFNEHLIGIPLIFMEDFADAYEKRREDGRKLAIAVANGSVNRLYYLPPPPVEFVEMQYGAFVYMNLISTFHLMQLSSSHDDKICALSAYGLSYADRMLMQHLFRPKAEALTNYGAVYRPITITAGPR